MTMSTDVLLVGGPANGRMFCVVRPAPVTVEVVSIDPAGMLAYTIGRWWHDEMLRWFWIATRAEDNVNNSDIKYEIQDRGFAPAWDMANKPAPDNGSHT